MIHQMKKRLDVQLRITGFLLHFLLGITILHAQNHPSLILTKKGVVAMKGALGKAPLFDKALSEAKAMVEAEIKSGIDVPVPKDMSGGYTHERHKQNWFALQKAGVLFQITGDKKYASFHQGYADGLCKTIPHIGIASYQ